MWAGAGLNGAAGGLGAWFYGLAELDLIPCSGRGAVFMTLLFVIWWIEGLSGIFGYFGVPTDRYLRNLCG